MRSMSFTPRSFAEVQETSTCWPFKATSKEMQKKQKSNWKYKPCLLICLQSVFFPVSFPVLTKIIRKKSIVKYVKILPSSFFAFRFILLDLIVTKIPCFSIHFFIQAMIVILIFCYSYFYLIFLTILPYCMLFLHLQYLLTIK